MALPPCRIDASAVVDFIEHMIFHPSKESRHYLAFLSWIARTGSSRTGARAGGADAN
jgi:hypothetical protein